MGKGYYEEVIDDNSFKSYGGTAVNLVSDSGSVSAAQLISKAEQQALQTMAEKEAFSKLYSESSASYTSTLKDAKGKVAETSGTAKLTNVDDAFSYVEVDDTGTLKGTIKDTTGKTSKGSYIEATGVYESTIKDAKGELIDLASGTAEISNKDSKKTTEVSDEFSYIEATDTMTSAIKPYITYVSNKKVTSTAVDDINAKVEAIAKDVDDIKSYINKLNAPNNLDLYGNTLNRFRTIVNAVDSTFGAAKKAVQKYEDNISDVENTYSRKYEEMVIPSIKTAGEIPALVDIVEPAVPTIIPTITSPLLYGPPPSVSPTVSPSPSPKPTLTPLPTATVVIEPPTTPIPIGTVPLYELPADDTAHLTPTDVTTEIGKTPARSNSGYSGGYVSPVEAEPEPEPEPEVIPETIPLQEAPAEITFVPDYSYDEPVEENIVSEPQVSYIQEETSGGSNSGLKIAGGLALAAGATLGTYATTKAIKDKKGEDDDDEDEDDDGYPQYSRRYGDR